MNLKPLLRHPHGNQQRLDDLTRRLFGGFAEFVLEDPPADRELQYLVRLDVAHPPPPPPAPTCIRFPPEFAAAIAAHRAAAEENHS